MSLIIIDLLSQFSKIIKKSFTHKLDLFLENNNLFYDYQYRFQSNRSTAVALIHLTDEICLQ